MFCGHAWAAWSIAVPDVALPVRAEQPLIDSMSHHAQDLVRIRDWRVCGTFDCAADTIRCGLRAEGW
jgi:hypothetical protein